MALFVYQNSEKLMEIDEAMKSASKDLMKMNHNILHLLNVGLPNPADSKGKFIGKEDYMKQLHNILNYDLGNLLEETTLERIASCIKLLSTMNAVLDKFLDTYKNISSKYSMLTRLQLFMYNLNKTKLPNDAK